MNNRKLQNKILDEFGQKLLKANRVSGEEIEKIIANSQLFEGIQNRLKAQQSQTNSSIWQFWNWQKLGLTFGVLVVLVLGAVSLISVNKKADLAQKIQPINLQISQKASVNFVAQTDKNSDGKKQKFAQPIVFKKELPKSIQPTRIKPKTQPKDLAEQEFYPLTFAGDLEEAKKDGQIIRVELPRESLNAIGLNLPIENESETVKAEFLISSDGITKGVRLVKK